MKAEFMHIGIPVTNRKNGMVYEDKYKVWVTDPDNLLYGGGYAAVSG